MTYEKAIEMLKERKFGAAIRGHEETAEMCEMAIKALEKQEPKKPIIRETEDYFGYVKCVICPNCKEVDFGFEQPCFCKNCGQAIDWGESE